MDEIRYDGIMLYLKEQKFSEDALSLQRKDIRRASKSFFTRGVIFYKITFACLILIFL